MDVLYRTHTRAGKEYAREREQNYTFLFQIERLEKEYAIFVPADGHVPVVALVAKDIDYIAKAFHEVTKD